MKLKDFQCIKCGECCRHLDKIQDLAHLQINGICKYLSNNLCSIYNNRPIICNRYKLYEKYKNVLTEDEFMEDVVYYCELLKKVNKE